MDDVETASLFDRPADGPTLVMERAAQRLGERLCVFRAQIRDDVGVKGRPRDTVDGAGQRARNEARG